VVEAGRRMAQDDRIAPRLQHGLLRHPLGDRSAERRW
jgi:hypothetical protein